MSGQRKRSARVAALLALVALVIALAVAVTACGDKYEGTWVKPGNTTSEMIIKKSGDGYNVDFKTGEFNTAEAGNATLTLKAAEKNGKLEVQNPVGGGVLFTATVDGDTMTVSMQGRSETLQRK